MPKLVHRDRIPKKAREAIIALVRSGNTIETAARAAGIHRDTFYDWMKRGRAGEKAYEAFADEVDRAVAQSEALNVATVRAAGAKSWQAAAWLLERRHSENWARRERVDVNHAGALRVDMAKLSDEDLQKIVDGTFVDREPLEPR